MKIYTLKKTINIDTDLKTAWDFFSSPKNLGAITPDFMKFKITSQNEEKMYQGQIITYFVRPVLNIPIQWVTEITHVEDLKYFVDEQRFGPYKFWHHKHFFNKTDSGIEITDIVHYALPFGFLGRIANSLTVQKKLEHIFNYREQKIKEIFK